MNTEALSPKEFEQEACLLAMEIVTQVLKPKQQLQTAVVLDALLRVYLAHAKSLPAPVQGACAIALGGLAAELVHTAVTPQSAPTGASVH